MNINTSAITNGTHRGIKLKIAEKITPIPIEARNVTPLAFPSLSIAHSITIIITIMKTKARTYPAVVISVPMRLAKDCFKSSNTVKLYHLCNLHDKNKGYARLFSGILF